MLWEPCTKWDSLFKEVWPTFAEADQVQAIGDTADNTRVSIPAFGSGIASNTLKLSLRKYVSPWVDLWVRIETDNAGEPSGTLFDPDAISTVLESGLTTYLVDTTVTLADTITIPKWEKVHIVLFAGTYGSETINGTNYFGVGYKPQDTTTRRAKTYDGADWSTGQATRFYYVTGDWITASDTGSPVSDTGITFQYSTAKTEAYWYRIQASKNIKIQSVTKSATSTATRAILKTDWGVTIQTASFSGNVATFATPYLVLDWEFVRIECDNSGGSYIRHYRNWATYPQARTNIIYNTGSKDWANDGAASNIESITTQEQTIVYGEDLFSNKLLSKTDATYSYKLPNDIPRFAKSDWAIGEKVKCSYLGIADLFVGLECWEIYKYSNIPWKIEKSTTNSNLIVWKAINENTLLIWDNIIRPVEDITFFAKSWVDTWAFDYTITIWDLEKWYYQISWNWNGAGPGSSTSSIYIKLNWNQIIYWGTDGVVHYYTAYLKKWDVLNFTGGWGSRGSFAYIRWWYRKNKPKFNYS